MKRMSLEESEWGIANRFDDCIEMNTHLKKFPKLYYPLLLHELQHTDSTFSMQDLKHDLISDNKVKQWDLIKFMIQHPKSFTQLLPFYYSRKRGFHLDINLSLVWMVMISIISSTIFFSLKYL